MSAAHCSTNGGAQRGDLVLGRRPEGAAALKAENGRLRAEIAGLRSPAAASRGDDAPPRELGMLAEVVLPADAAAPGAARVVIAHCLTALVARRVVGDAELVASELVTNSLRHAALRDADAIVVRIYLGEETLRLEIDNPGTVGIVATRVTDPQCGVGGFGLVLVEQLAARWGVRRTDSTSVWVEMARA
jgi:serine/threonine-protein kinase RsbW